MTRRIPPLGGVMIAAAYAQHEDYDESWRPQ